MTVEEQLLEMVQRDHDMTVDFIESLVGTATTIRGWAVTVWLAVLGLAVERSRPAFAVGAAIVVIAFAVLDDHHSWLYSEASRHARSIERIYEARFRWLVHGRYRPELEREYRALLEAHRVGFFYNLRRWSVLRSICALRGRTFLLGFYLPMAAVAIIASLIIQSTGKPSH